MIHASLYHTLQQLSWCACWCCQGCQCWTSDYPFWKICISQLSAWEYPSACLERHTCLLTLGHNPRRTVYHADVVLCKILDVDKRYTCPTAKDEEVSCKCHVGVSNFISVMAVSSVQGQELTFLVVWVNMVPWQKGFSVSCHCSVLLWQYVSEVWSKSRWRTAQVRQYSLSTSNSHGWTPR